MLNTHADLAEEILEKCSGYIDGKRLIHSFFDNVQHDLTLNEIVLRLTIIDSFYSTQMNKRLYGINEVARALISVYSNDIELTKDLKRFTETRMLDDKIQMLFSNKYGLTKKGKSFGMAVSLLSKYFYFLSNYRFPIYDSLVKDSLPQINDKFAILPQRKINNDYKLYFEYLYDFNHESKINNFNKLDNLCWLYGKVKKGSFSLILEKDKYQDLINRAQIEKINGSTGIDIHLSEYIKSNPLSGVFTIEQIKFIAFVNKIT